MGGRGGEKEKEGRDRKWEGCESVIILSKVVTEDLSDNVKFEQNLERHRE